MGGASFGYLDADVLRNVCLEKEKELKEEQERTRRRYETAVSLMKGASTSGEFRHAAAGSSVMLRRLSALSPDTLMRTL